MSSLRGILNQVRNVVLFRVMYPWIKTGRNVHCQFGVRFISPNHDIRMGNNVGIGFDCLFQCDTHLGNDVFIASSVAFINRDDHRYDVVGKTMWQAGRGEDGAIVVEDDTWIGHGVIIMAPCRIGEGAIIASGAVVREDVAPYSIVGGVPARVLKMRFTPEQIEEHRRLLNRS